LKGGGRDLVQSTVDVFAVSTEGYHENVRLVSNWVYVRTPNTSLES